MGDVMLRLQNVVITATKKSHLCSTVSSHGGDAIPHMIRLWKMHGLIHSETHTVNSSFPPHIVVFLDLFHTSQRIFTACASLPMCCLILDKRDEQAIPCPGTGGSNSLAAQPSIWTLPVRAWDKRNEVYHDTSCFPTQLLK